MCSKFMNVLLGATALSMAAATVCFSQDKNLPKEYYLAASVPDSLKENANAVIRYSSDEITIKGAGREVQKHHSITAILNQDGDDEAEIVIFYNKKYDNYSNIEIKVFDAGGKVIKKYHKSDMYERSAVDEETIVTDERLIALRHVIPSYPATIEIEYEENISSYLSLGGWSIRPNTEVAVQNSACKVVVNPAVGFRYKNVNVRVSPEKGKQDDYDTYTWQVKNLKAYKPEKNILPWQKQQNVTFASNSFEFYGLPGSLESWKSFGNWISALNAGVCSLSPERTAEIVKMTDTIKSDKDKARFLYKYLQQTTRYVSIQLGIGGYKPFPATFVDQKKYGDCKALANYMKAMLKAVNIPSYYAIINAGVNEKPVDVAFPINEFNHAILCIPFKNDTTWIDCTSTTQPFGKLGTFTENRRALLITEDGGKLVNTPVSTRQDNEFDSYAHVTLNADGGAKAQLKLKSTGEYRSMYVGLAAGKVDEQKEFLIRYLNMKQPASFEFKESPDKDGVKEMNIDLDYDRFCDMSVGDKQFYKPMVIDVWRATFPETEKRKHDFYFDHPMQKSCITTIDLPVGYELETLPANVKLKFTYGDFEADYQYNKDKNQVTSTLKFNLNTQVIPAAKYTEMQQYMDDIVKAENKKMVIRKKA